MSDGKVETASPTYNRPQHTWVCGHSPDGHPCSLGPSAAGVCRVETPCQPVLRQNQWVCGVAGDPCQNGPTSTGACPCQAEKCRPRRSVRARRGLWALGAATLVCGLLTLAFSGPWKIEILAPGPLSPAHAQILQGERRCQACHPAAAAGVGEWLLATMQRGAPFADSQTDLCLQCHDKSFAVETARLAHGMDPTLLSQITQQHSADLKPERINTIPVHLRGQIACRTCHREHHGRADLSALTTEQCQVCHLQPFDSFEEDHRDFGDWPYGHSRSVNFDHGKHIREHFPQENRDVSCRQCHLNADRKEVQAVADYEAACAVCHDRFLAQAGDVAVVSLPRIDPEALAEIRLTVGQWPAAAAGDFDGGVPIFARILLLTDKRAQAAMERLGYDFEFIDIDPEDEQQLRDAAQIAWSLKKLIYELAKDGQAGIKRRFEKLLGRELTVRELARVSGRFPPSVFREAQVQWFPNLAAEVISRKLVEAGPRSDSTPLDSHSAEAVAAGGWYVDHQICAIFYQPTGHHDELTRGWLELLNELTGHDAFQTDYGWREEFTGLRLASQCVACHAEALRGVWTGAPSTDDEHRFTHFDHGPHLVLPTLADCSSCHGLDRAAAAEGSARNTVHADVSRATDFASLDRLDCAACHTADGAGNECTKCHRYHVSTP